MPTILQLLSDLPEPYNEQAITNCSCSVLAFVNQDATSYDALVESFVWFKSPQGHDYWEDFSKGLEGYESGI